MAKAGFASAIIMRPIDTLKPFARNSRLHSTRQVSQIAESIKEFGFTTPILTDRKGNIVAGHGRVLAATELGMTEVPTIDVSYMTPKQRRAYVIADNKLALNATWDLDLLTTELSDLDAGGFDLGVIGFSEGDLVGLGLGGMNAGDAPVDNVKPSWAVVVECADESQQVALLARLEAEGLKCKGASG